MCVSVSWLNFAEREELFWTWLFHSTPESKQVNKEWRKKGEPEPVKAKSWWVARLWKLFSSTDMFCCALIFDTNVGE